MSIEILNLRVGFYVGYPHEWIDADPKQGCSGYPNVLYNLKNTSTKTIKYIILYINFYNAVGDIVHTLDVEYTGPLNPNEETGKLGNTMYDAPQTITRGFIHKLKIVYMDNSEEIIDRSSLSPGKIKISSLCYNKIKFSISSPNAETIYLTKDFPSYEFEIIEDYDIHINLCRDSDSFFARLFVPDIISSTQIHCNIGQITNIKLDLKTGWNHPTIDPKIQRIDINK